MAFGRQMCVLMCFIDFCKRRLLQFPQLGTVSLFLPFNALGPLRFIHRVGLALLKEAAEECTQSWHSSSVLSILRHARRSNAVGPGPGPVVYLFGRHFGKEMHTVETLRASAR